MSKILITRPEGRAEETAADLRAMGFDPLVAPVLKVAAMGFYVPDAGRYGGLLLTSGIATQLFTEALPKGHGLYDLPVFVVGDQTSRLARDAGFNDVRSASGDVDDLVALVREEGAGKDKPYLHVRGKHVSAPLHVLLAAQGVAVDILQVYDTVFANCFTADVLAAFEAREIEAVMLYSARSAQAFAALINHHGLAGALVDIKVLSISKAVLGYVQSYQWVDMCHAETPDRASLYALLSRVCVPD